MVLEIGGDQHPVLDQIMPGNKPAGGIGRGCGGRVYREGAQQSAARRFVTFRRGVGLGRIRVNQSSIRLCSNSLTLVMRLLWPYFLSGMLVFVELFAVVAPVTAIMYSSDLCAVDYAKPCAT